MLVLTKKIVSFLFAGFFTKVFQAGEVEDDWEQSPPNSTQPAFIYEKFALKISPQEFHQLKFVNYYSLLLVLTKSSC